ncbi:pilin [Patescibacteria group bacterium]|nr:pilin [Patescibacteria group bacterium]MBU4274210.1 pilin [Patescibacteria group bacterium]MBU4367306.1 pilin [Patescibacteria group bacterium]MBU4461643.1 pilin [Patescibacteria group bacterium]MCG2699693.1 pilin [Candidatus Parcubacteria bacterium]
MKKIYILPLLIIIGVSFVSLATAAEITNPLGNTKDIKTLITKIADGVVVIIGPIATIMLIVAGILYLTSAGNPERINNAKTALIYAVIGIAVAISAKGVAEFIGTTLK